MEPLPDDLIARVENAKNNVTIMTAEYNRLLKLSSEMTVAVNNKHIEEKDLIDKVSALEIKKEDIIKVVEDETIELSKIQKEENDLQEKIVMMNTELEQYIAHSAARTSDLDAREKVVISNEKDIERRTTTLTEREKEHLSKVEQLKKAIATIWQV